MSEERLRVLLVDDEESFRVPLQQFLARTFGYEVDEASMPATARDKVESATRPYDVALIDDLLIPQPGAKPQQIGIELIEDIRRRSPETECIVLTGWGKDRELAALEAGAFRYLAKPFDGRELALLIRTAAQQVRLRAIGRAILAEQELDRVLDGIAGAACSLASADEAAIVLRDEGTGRLQVHAKTRHTGKQWWQHFAGGSLSREIIRQGHIERVPDTRQDPRVDPRLVEAGIRCFLGLPIPGDDGNLGALYVYGYQAGYFDEWGTIAVLQTLAGQAGLAIANARNFDQVRTHASYMDALVRSGQGLTRATELEDQLALAWEFVREQLQVSTFFIGLYDPSTGLLHFPLAYEQGERQEIPDRLLGDDRSQWGISGYAVRAGEELVWSSSGEEQQVCAALGIRSIAVGTPPPQQTCFCLPLGIGDQVVGVMSIQSYAPHAFSPILLDAFRALGSQLAVALENTRLLDQARRSSEQSAALNRIVYEIGSEPDVYTLLRSVVERAVRLLSAAGGAVYLLEPGSEFHILAESVGMPLPLKGLRLRSDEGFGGEILRAGKALTVDDYSHWDRRLTLLDELGLWAVAGAPICIGDQVLGILMVHTTSAGRRFDQDLALLQQLANHAGLALQKVKLLDKLRAIQDVSTTITSALDFQQVLNRTCQAAVELFAADHSGLVLFDDSLEWGTVRGEYPSEPSTLGARIAVKGVPVEEELVRSRQYMMYPDLDQDIPGSEPVREFLRGLGIRSICLVPIVYRDRILGSFSLDAVRHTRTFTPDEIELSKVFAAQVAVAIENARLFEATREGQAFVQSLYEATTAIISHTEPNRVGQAIVDTACAATGAVRAAVVLVDDGQQPVALAQAGFDLEMEPEPPIRAAGISHQVIRSGRPRFFPDLLRAGHEVHPAMVRRGTRAAACLPLQVRSRMLGVLWIQYQETQPFSQIEQHALQIYASQAAIALENARLYEETRRREQLLATLDEASRHIRAQRETSRLLHEIVRLAVELVGATAGCLFVHRPYLGDLELRVACNLPTTPIGTRLSNERGLAGHVAQTGKSRAIHDYDAWADREGVFDPLGFRAAIGVPLESTGQIEAVLLLGYSPDVPPPTATTLEVLERFAVQAAIAWRTSRLMGREQRMLAQLGILHEISNFIQAAGDLDKILHVVLTGVTASYGLGFNRAALFLLDQRREFLVGQMGIGHLDEAKAREDWERDQALGLDSFQQYLQRTERERFPLTPVGERVRELRFPATSYEFQLFMSQLCQKRCALVTIDDLRGTPESFAQAFEPAFPLVVVPLMARGQPIGLLVADNKFTRDPITPEDQEALLTFVNTAAVAIDNAQLFQQARVGQNRLRSFYEASNTLVTSRDVEQVLQDIVGQATAAAGASSSSMILIDRQTGQVRDFVSSPPLHSVDLTKVIRPNGLSMEVMATGLPVYYEDAEAERPRVNPTVFDRGIGAALSVPVLLEGERIGVMWFHYSEPRRFLLSEIEAGQLYANQAALAYESARRITELEHMRQAAQALAGAGSLQEVLKQIAGSAQLVLHADSTAIWSYDEVCRQFIPEELAFCGVPQEVWERFRKVEPKEGGTAYTVMRNGWVGVTDIRESAGHEFEVGRSTRQLLESIGARSFQGAVLRVGDETLGVLYANYDQPRSFGDAEQRTLKTFASHAALALKNARLLAQMERVKRAAETIADVTVQEDLGQTLRTIARHTRRVMSSDSVNLYSYDEALQVFDNWAVDMPEQRDPHSLRPPSRLTSRSATQVVLDLEGPPFYVAVEDRVSEHPLLGGLYSRAEDVRAVCGVQLRMGGRRMGVMFINFRSRHRFTSDELATIQLFADQAAVAIRNAQLYREYQERATMLESLYTAAQAVTGSLSLPAVLMQIAEQAWRLAEPAGDKQAQFSHLALRDGNRLKFEAAYPPEHVDGLRARIGEIDLEGDGVRQIGITGQAVKTGKTLRVDDVAKHPEYLPYDANTRSELAVPLLVADQAIGVINVEHSDAGAFGEEDEQALKALAAQATLAIHNARLYAELQQRYDDLHQIKGFVGSQTVLQWMRMVSGVWGHGIKRDVGTSLVSAELVRHAIQEGDHAAALRKLADLERKVEAIKEIPITAPLSAEDVVAPIRVNQVIEAYLHSLWTRRGYAQMQVEFELDLQPDLDEIAAVRASPEWLRRGLEIVVENAVYAMLEADSRQKVLRVTTRMIDGQIEIRVHDTGPGFPEQIKPKLFEEPVEKGPGSPGAGIGLVLARTIFDAYRGSIGLGDPGPEGALVIMSLPVEAERDGAGE